MVETIGSEKTLSTWGFWFVFAQTHLALGYRLYCQVHDTIYTNSYQSSIRYHHKTPSTNLGHTQTTIYFWCWCCTPPFTPPVLSEPLTSHGASLLCFSFASFIFPMNPWLGLAPAFIPPSQMLEIELLVVLRLHCARMRRGQSDVEPKAWTGLEHTLKSFFFSSTLVCWIIESPFFRTGNRDPVRTLTNSE